MCNYQTFLLLKGSGCRSVSGPSYLKSYRPVVAFATLPQRCCQNHKLSILF